MASSFLKGLVTDYGKLGYQLWHRPLKMASLVYEREIGGGDPRAFDARVFERSDEFIEKDEALTFSKTAFSVVRD